MPIAFVPTPQPWPPDLLAHMVFKSQQATILIALKERQTVSVQCSEAFRPFAYPGWPADKPLPQMLFKRAQMATPWAGVRRMDIFRVADSETPRLLRVHTEYEADDLNEEPIE